MDIYAVIKNGIVINTIVSDSSEPLYLFFPEAIIVKQTEETGTAHINGDMLYNKFRRPRPFPSWEWSDSLWDWKAPVEYPQDEDSYWWDEDEKSWVKVLPYIPEEIDEVTTLESE